ncbi:MAG TPA: hypothetical protein VD929_06650 [Caulobacteraceae bacterium]|nr:hypothetical protein [Caulobacteraceae bacterium]
MRKSETHVLAEIAEIRRVQRLAAEARFQRSRAAELRAEAAHAEALDRLAQDETAWNERVTGASVQIDSVMRWSGIIARDEAELRVADEGVRSAAAERATDSDAWSAAQARARTAEDAARTAGRADERRREEALSAELADRVSRAGRGR